MSAMPTTIRNALIRLLIASCALVGLAIGCFSNVDRGLVGIMGCLLVVVVLPATILMSVDASRAIKQGLPQHKSIRILGAVLGFPQAVLGTLLISFGLVYPFIGIRDLMRDLDAGRSGIGPFVTTVTAFLMLGVGYYYLREGLGLRKKKNGQH